MTCEYEGKLKCNLTHKDSGSHVLTSAPVDNCGDGSSFSPTDLFATSLAACMATIMGIKANTMEGVSLEGLFIEVEKIMSQSLPRRIEKLSIKSTWPSSMKNTDSNTLEILKKAGMNCPVLKSVHPDIMIETEWDYK